MYASRFTAAAAVVAVLAPLAAIAGSLVLGVPVAFRGSVGVSAAVLLVFTAHNLASIRSTGSQSFASAVVATVFGIWLAYAPLVYDAGFLATALTQLAGMLTAAFSAHTALDALAAMAGGLPETSPEGGLDDLDGDVAGPLGEE